MIDYGTPIILSIRLKQKQTPFDGTEFLLESQPLSRIPLRHESKSFIGETELEAYLSEQKTFFGLDDGMGKDLIESVKKSGAVKHYVNCAPVPW
jgi:hypothetical protein